MIILDDVNRILTDLAPKIKTLKNALHLDADAVRLSELEQTASQASFWDNADAGKTVLSEMASIKQKAEKFANLKSVFADAQGFAELAEDDGDEALLDEVESAVKSAEDLYEKMHLETLLSGEYDKNNAILTFHAGAGGTEAQDWVEMLYRMYQHFALSHGFKTELLDCLEGDDAGIKSASVLVSGQNAYGYLKSEHGVHRLVRISPFDSSGRRHTSFASLEVMPEINEDIDEVDIRPEDIKMDVYHSSGAGGQNVNKTSSAVRLTHLPTGIVVACQTQRSQLQNKNTAYKLLQSRLMQIKTQEHLDKIEDIKGVQNQIAWGSQIRSYVFMPYTLVKDHRTGFESGNVDAVMDGDLDGFINAYLAGDKLEK
ncbi:MAG: peptide chain release factor 2 [Oscillospiraceae bacterium]